MGGGLLFERKNCGIYRTRGYSLIHPSLEKRVHYSEWVREWSFYAVAVQIALFKELQSNLNYRLYVVLFVSFLFFFTLFTDADEVVNFSFFFPVPLFLQLFIQKVLLGNHKCRGWPKSSGHIIGNHESAQNSHSMSRRSFIGLGEQVKGLPKSVGIIEGTL